MYFLCIHHYFHTPLASADDELRELSYSSILLSHDIISLESSCD